MSHRTRDEDALPVLPKVLDTPNFSPPCFSCPPPPAIFQQGTILWRVTFLLLSGAQIWEGGQMGRGGRKGVTGWSPGLTELLMESLGG